jgi:hypothetical protein
MDIESLLDPIEGFDWDDGNSLKNWEKHQVSQEEAQSVFFNRPLIVIHGKYPEKEKRWGALGKTEDGRELFIAFTIRNSKLRVISARPMSELDRRIYHGG